MARSLAKKKKRKIESTGKEEEKARTSPTHYDAWSP